MSGPRIERNEDPAVADALDRSVGWLRGARESARRFESGGLHWVARDDAGRVLGGAFLQPYGADLAWVAGMVVVPDARGRGLGRRLLAACLDEADRRGIACVGLDATEAGRPLYESEGFVAVAGTERLARPAGADPVEPPSTRFAIYPISVSELPEVAAFDRARFGANRATWLAAVMQDAPERAFLAYDRASGALGGFAMGQERFIGPCVADDPDAAGALLAACERAGTPAVLHDLAMGAASRVTRGLGYAPVGVRCVRMVRGGPLPGRPESVFAVGAWAVG